MIIGPNDLECDFILPTVIYAMNFLHQKQVLGILHVFQILKIQDHQLYRSILTFYIYICIEIKLFILKFSSCLFQKMWNFYWYFAIIEFKNIHFGLSLERWGMIKVRKIRVPDEYIISFVTDIICHILF
jgi:hypothetical protein